MSKVVVCGSTGILGQNLVEAMPVCLQPTRKCINYLDMNSIEEYFKNVKTCINCIADRNLESCESDWETTKQVNADIPLNIYTVCNKLNINFIHISTDYVFDGTDPPYTSLSKPNPLQNYGKSKLLAEQLVHENSVIIRVPVLYSKYGNDVMNSLIRKTINKVEQSDEDDYFPRRPVYIPDLCAFIIDHVNNFVPGIYHFWNPTNKYTKFETVQVIGDVLHVDTSHISKSVNKYVANRPFDTELTSEADIYKYHHTSLRDGIYECVRHIYHPPFNQSGGTDIFYLVDLDGTLIDSERAHYNAYVKAGLEMSWEAFEMYVHTDGLPSSSVSDEMRALKQVYIQDEDIGFVLGAEEFIQFLSTKNHVVVTNTSKYVVEIFKNKLPLLNSLRILTREDYGNPKPSPAGYNAGLCKYYKNERYIVGFENSVQGYESLKQVTDCIYIVTQPNSKCYSRLKNKLVYFIPDYTNSVLYKDTTDTSI